MISGDLQKNWLSLESKKMTNQYDLHLLSESSHPDLFIARTPDGHRALVLSLTSLEHLEFKDIEGENLALLKDTHNNFIVIKLINAHFRDLFDYLVTSIGNAISNVSKSEVYANTFLRSFSQWMQFFVILPEKKLKQNIVQGIFGELVVLEILLKEQAMPEIDNILRAWDGPFDRGSDFILENKNIEVKTRVEGNYSVKIASENQLDQADGKNLELAVVRLDSKNAAGFTLSQLIEKIVLICEKKLGDVAILFEALQQKNLVPSNFADYDEYIFHPSDITFFDCGSDGFPKLTRSSLPDVINNVNYSINTNGINDFEIRKAHYDIS